MIISKYYRIKFHLRHIKTTLQIRSKHIILFSKFIASLELCECVTIEMFWNLDPWMLNVLGDCVRIAGATSS